MLLVMDNANRRVEPAPQVIDHLVKRGVPWGTVEQDLNTPEVVIPHHSHDGSHVLMGKDWCGRVCEHTYDPSMAFLFAVWPRQRAESNPEDRVVGIESKRPVGPRVRGGRGSRWPASWPELEKRLLAIKGVTLVKRTKHVAVVRNGKIVDVLPETASEYRGLMNACLALKRRGIDVSR